MDSFLQFIKDYGIVGFLAIVLLLIIQDPDRAAKLQLLFIKPFFQLFKWGSKRYIASEVSSTTNEFVDEQIRRLIPSIRPTKVNVKWVTSPQDPVLSQDGTLILRLQESNDQTMNVLAAARVALPRIVCPTLRPNVEKYASSAIDLALMHGFADKIGKHARPVFHRYFLTPEIQEDHRVGELFKQLVELDKAGIFVSILLEELNVLGEDLYSSGDNSDKTESVLLFVQYLLGLAKREVGEKINLDHLSPEFKVGIILLAVSKKAELEGVSPYLRRIERIIKLGCDSIYIVAYPPARQFLSRILAALETEPRLTFAKRVAVHSFSPMIGVESGLSQVALLRRNALFDHHTFEQAAADLQLAEGMGVTGTVNDVSADIVLLDVGGLLGIVSRKEASWYSISDCRDVLKVGSVYQCVISSIDRQRDQLHLSLRVPSLDPWCSAPLPNVGDVIEVTVHSYQNGALVSRSDKGIEILIPEPELSWFSDSVASPESLVGTRCRVVVYEKVEDAHLLRASVRRLVTDPWPEIHRRFPIGTVLNGVVVEVTPHVVRVEISDGIVGQISRDAMIQGGYEYSDFEKNVVPGQGLQVVVTKVFVAKRKIRLDLCRNLPPQLTAKKGNNARKR